MTDARRAYGEWCPTCGAGIVSVTRGIPSMGTCSNGHTTDRRDTLRRSPVDPVATELAALRAENAAALDRIARLEAALTALGKASAEVARLGAVTGPQWSRLTIASLKARAALAPAATTEGGA
jgi:hypothetical protein